MLIHRELKTQWRKLGFVLAVGFISLSLSLEALRLVAVSVLTDLGDESSLKSALNLDEQNDRVHQRLGSVYRWEQLDTPAAVLEFRRAAQLRPHVAAYWADLGEACDVTADRNCAEAAFVRAAELAPMSPRLQWRIVDHYLLNSEQHEAQAHLARFLELDPRDAESAFEVSSRAFSSPDALWRALQPLRDQDLLFGYVNYLAANGQLEQADRYWSQLVGDGVKPSFLQATPYLRELLAASRIDQASAVWQQLQTVGVIPPATSGNLIYNPGFKQDPLGFGFDWQLQKQSFVSLQLDADAFRGQRSLRVDFLTGTNADFELVRQLVPVRPNLQYALQAFARSQGISSDSGPRLRVQDAACVACLDISTESTTGSSGWHRLQASFVTGPQTHALWVSLWRPRSRNFPSEISGQFWLDEVTLTPAASQGALARK